MTHEWRDTPVTSSRAVAKYWQIDGVIGGSGAEYINHSCAPNLRSRLVRGHILSFSTRPIARGEELTVDYRYFLPALTSVPAGRSFFAGLAARTSVRLSLPHGDEPSADKPERDRPREFPSERHGGHESTRDTKSDSLFAVAGRQRLLSAAFTAASASALMIL
jgi:hypothetical protein